MDPGVNDERPPERVRAINAPWPSLAVAGAIVASFVVQILLIPDAEAGSLGFAATDLETGRWWTPLTMMFVHGGWAHALMNAGGALAFGPPVARLMGGKARGVLVFFGFYLVCGVLACLGYAAFHLHNSEPAIGASGAVSGLMGAAARLIGMPPGRLGPIHSRPVYSLGLSWIVINILIAFAGAPLMPGARIAWEAHIAGFITGVFLVGPFARLAGWREPEESPF